MTSDNSTSDVGVDFIVWGFALLMGAGVIGLAVAFGSPFPVGDEWNHTRRLASAIDNGTPYEWIFTTAPEQRWPFRLLRTLVYRSSLDSLNPLLVFNALGVFFCGVLTLWSVKRIRGVLTVSDLLIPLAIFGPAHVVEILHYNKASFIWPSCMICATYSALLSGNGRWGLLSAIMVSLVTIMLPHLGITGVIHTPLLLVATSIIALRQSGATRRILIAGLVLSGIGLLLNTGTTLMAISGAGSGAVKSGVWGDEFGTFLAFHASSSGILAKRVWPLTGVIPVLCVGTALMYCVKDMVTQKNIRECIIPVCAVGTTILIGLVIAAVRDRSFVPTVRYAMLATPALCLSYVALTRRKSRVSASFQHLMMFWVAMQFWYSAAWATDVAQERRSNSDKLSADLISQVDDQKLAARHATYWAEGKEESFLAGVAAYRQLNGMAKREPATWDVELAGSDGHSEKPVTEINLSEHQAVLLTGLDSQKKVDLIQVHYTLESPGTTAHMSIEWQTPAASGWVQTRSAEKSVNLLVGEGHRTATFEIDAAGSVLRWKPGITEGKLTIHHIYARYGR